MLIGHTNWCIFYPLRAGHEDPQNGACICLLFTIIISNFIMACVSVIFLYSSKELRDNRNGAVKVLEVFAWLFFIPGFFVVVVRVLS